MGILKKIKMLERICQQQYEFNKEVVSHNDKADELQKIEFSQIKEEIKPIKKEIEFIKKTLLINSISIGVVSIAFIVHAVANAFG